MVTHVRKIIKKKERCFMNNKCVPNIISTKNMDFLQDIYNRNYRKNKNTIKLPEEKSEFSNIL